MADDDDVPRDEAQDSPESLDDSRQKLRRRWELASVLSFLTVFEPVIGEDLKLSAEEIEMALINPDASLAKLHVALLKGIPPVNKNLSKPDGWVTVLCKKLAEWWPWVAEGEIPLTATKGEEISKYKKLDPTIRLQMLKALCELRSEQDDLMSYINDALKEGKQPSQFRKDKICEDGTGISYWYDGNSVIGHRLYREVKKSVLKPKQKGKGCLDPPSTTEWETLATNLDEFREVLEQLSSRRLGLRRQYVRLLKLKSFLCLSSCRRALKRQQRQDALLNGYQSFAVGVTRSCRARRPVSYTFDEYDRVIDEALKSTRKRKDQEVQTYGRKRQRQRKVEKSSSDEEDSEKNAVSEDEGSPGSTDEEAEDDRQVEDSDKEDDDDDNDSKSSDGSGEDNSEKNESEEGDDGDGDGDGDGSESDESNDTDHEEENGMPPNDSSKNDDKNYAPDSSSDDDHPETRNLGAKNRLRQRPTRNTALESPAVSESNNESFLRTTPVAVTMAAGKTLQRCLIPRMKKLTAEDRCRFL